jgi:hypothetical protein
MADESGGDFGGGPSVHWWVTCGKDNLGGQDKKTEKTHEGKDRWRGADLDHDDLFYIELQVPNNPAEKQVLLDSMADAVADLTKGRGSVQVRLPINKPSASGEVEKQVRVLWKRHQGVGG